MPVVDEDRWTAPTSAWSRFAKREGLIQRHIWPPSLPGLVVVVVVLSVLIGVTGGWIYARSESGQVELQDPAGPEPVADITVPEAAGQEEQTSTTKPILSVEALGDEVAPSVWRVSTRDEAGRPVEASAVVAGSFGGQSFLLTSFSAVRASTRVPGPPLVVRNGGQETEATLWTWQEDRDLALLVIQRAAPPLLWATENPEGKPNDRVFVAAEGSGLVSGKILVSSTNGIQHNISVDDRRRGGALVNEKGEVLGMASRDYDPGGVGTDRIFVAVPMRLACGQVLQCGGGNATVGASTTTTPPID
ncbi:MAG TPA: S1C family serine protease [Acidimicrobiales bacterium]|nr:S1C family serine protease [Acidimicrobiales bacterium]